MYTSSYIYGPVKFNVATSDGDVTLEVVEMLPDAREGGQRVRLSVTNRTAFEQLAQALVDAHKVAQAEEAKKEALRKEQAHAQAEATFALQGVAEKEACTACGQVHAPTEDDVPF
jgi:hypothetical protein